MKMQKKMKLKFRKGLELALAAVVAVGISSRLGVYAEDADPEPTPVVETVEEPAVEAMSEEATEEPVEVVETEVPTVEPEVIVETPVEVVPTPEVEATIEPEESATPEATATAEATAEASATPEASASAEASASPSPSASAVALEPVAVAAPPIVVRAPSVSAPVTIIVKDAATNAFIPNANFDFYKVDLTTGAETFIETATTNASGEATINVSEYGKYVARYKNDGSIDGTIYDLTAIVGAAFEITVSVDNTPGVQLTENWAWDLSGNLGNLKFRDVIADGDAVIFTGGFTSNDPVTIPGAYTSDGNPLTLDPANGQGLILKVDQVTSKLIWYSQTDNPTGNSYSVVKSGSTYISTNYNNGKVNVIDSTTGNVVKTIDVSEGMGGNAQFDICTTSDGGFVVTGWNNSITKYDANGDLVWKASGITVASGIKSVIETAPNQFVVSGGGNGERMSVQKITVANDGTYTTDFAFIVAPNGGEARFNDVLPVTENGQQYFLASGNIGCKTSPCTIPAEQTADGVAITLNASTPGVVQSTAALFKLDANGKVVWAVTLGGADITGWAEQEFNNVKPAYDSLGGYIVSGQLAGNANVAAEDTALGVATTVHTNDVDKSDSIVVRYTIDGKYVDSYNGGKAGSNDQYYGGVGTSDAYYTAGNDSSKLLVKLSSALTSSPRELKVPKITKYKLVTTVNSSTNGTISGLGMSYYEEIQDGGTNSRAIVMTPNAGYYLTKYEVIATDTGAVLQSVVLNQTTPYTLAAGAITMDQNKTVKAYFDASPVVTPTPAPTPTPGPATPTPGTRTCQDDGYPAGYYWNGTACVGGFAAPTAGVNTGFRAPSTDTGLEK